MDLDIRTEGAGIDNVTATAVSQCRAKGLVPTLWDIVASTDSAVHSYVRTKQRKAQQLDIRYEVFSPSVDQTTKDTIAVIERLNATSDVHGIILSSPMYSHLDVGSIVDAIDPRKDVDGLTATNIGYLACNEEDKALVPATAQAAVHIIEKVTTLNSKNVVVIGRGRTVGRPVAFLTVNRHATVTVCHSHSRSLSDITKSADVLIVAIGKPRFVTIDMVRSGQVVIDCGINFVDGKICGDVDATGIGSIVSYVSRVPGGVGVLTNSFLYANLIRAMAL